MRTAQRPSSREEVAMTQQQIGTVTRRATRRTRRPGSGLPIALIVPAVVALALALGYPLVRQVVMSFQEFGLAQQFGTAGGVGGAGQLPRAGHRPVPVEPAPPVDPLLPRQRRADDGDRQRGRPAAAADVGTRPDPRPERPAAGVGDAGARRADGVAVALRHAVRRRQLAAHAAGRRLPGPLVADRAVVLLLRGHRRGGVDERAVRRVHRLRRPDPGVRGPRRGRRARRRQRHPAAALRGAAQRQAGAARGRPAAGHLGPARLHPDLRAAAGRRGHPRHQPARHLHLPARHRRRRLRHRRRGGDLHARR